MSNDLLKSSNLDPKDLNLLREKFISEYSQKKGWNKDQFSPNQMFEIISQKEYKNPGLLLG